MARILLGLTGSVAAIKAPDLDLALRQDGHEVRLIATDAAAYFFDPNHFGERLTRDADEWPGERYTRGDPVRHIELRNWAELLLIAPLDANTLAKLAVGLCDNALTCVWRAWDMKRPVLLAPAMNTLMWQHPFTRRHLQALAMSFGGTHLPGHLSEEELIPLINDRCRGLKIIPPISKMLACGDVGVGAMAEVSTILAAIRQVATVLS